MTAPDVMARARELVRKALVAIGQVKGRRRSGLVGRGDGLERLLMDELGVERKEVDWILVRLAAEGMVRLRYRKGLGRIVDSGCRMAEDEARRADRLRTLMGLDTVADSGPEGEEL